jgi:hypothetical protein
MAVGPGRSLAWLPIAGAVQASSGASVRLLFPIIRGNELERSPTSSKVVRPV